jgi:hypothetical protein
VPSQNVLAPAPHVSSDSWTSSRNSLPTFAISLAEQHCGRRTGRVDVEAAQESRDSAEAANHDLHSAAIQAHLDYTALAKDQEEDIELQSLLLHGSALRLERINIPESPATI